MSLIKLTPDNPHYQQHMEIKLLVDQALILSAQIHAAGILATQEQIDELTAMHAILKQKLAWLEQNKDA